MEIRQTSTSRFRLRCRSARIIVIGAALATALLACGKARVDALQEHPELRWAEPTPANGFHPANTVWCPPANADATEIPTTSNGALEEIAIAKPEVGNVNAVAADKTSVYWTEVGARTGAVFRAERSSQRIGAWHVENLARGESIPGEIAVSNRFVYWTVGRDPSLPSEPGVRSFDLINHEVAKVATASTRPERLITDGSSIFWVDSPNTIREVSDKGPARDFTALSSLQRTMLAVDSDALYAFNEQTLFRIPRDNSRPTVLFSSTKTPPVDLAVDNGYVYWLEQGFGTNEACLPRCVGCFDRRNMMPRSSGSLSRVPVHGGAQEIIATDLPDVTKLAFLKGIAFVSTQTALLRINPLDRPKHPSFVSEGMGADARAAVIGDALVLGLRKMPTRVALLSRP